VTSGRGIVTAVHALRDFGITVRAVASVNEIKNFNAREYIRQETGLELISLIESELHH